MSKKPYIRILSFLLMLAILLQIVPAQAFATSSNENIVATVSPSEDSFEEADKKDVHIVEEITDKRTEYTKAFKLSNNLNIAAVYATSVHYKENGVWEEIDNTLQVERRDSKNFYTNKAGGWKVQLPQNLDTDSGVSVSVGEHTLTFHMDGELRKNQEQAKLSAATGATRTLKNVSYTHRAARPSAAVMEKVDFAKAKKDAEYPELVSEKISSRMRYSDIYENTDIVYDLNSNQLKESIIMEQYDDTLHGYSYVLKVENLTPVLREEGTIDLLDKRDNAVILSMPAPYLVDDAGESCYDVEVLMQEEKGAYLLSYILPQEWLADKDRVWPVVLDPIVEKESSNSSAEDETVYSNNPNADTHNANTINCGYDASGSGITRCYMKYNELPSLNSSDIIVAATIKLCRADSCSSTAVAVEVHAVTENWTESQIGWGDDPSFSLIAEDYAICSGQGYYAWDITDLARRWYTGENYGMVFKLSDEDENAGIANYKRFYSTEFTTDNGRPMLTIAYRNNNGLEDYWDYTASTAGRAGTGYINNYTGNLIWVHEDIGFGGTRMPVSIQHIYNTNDSGENQFGLGYGWRTNFNQLVYKFSDDYYVWEDADGTAHYFNDASGTFKDEDGLELTLTASGSGATTYCISDKRGNCSYFDAKGRLRKQENKYNTNNNIEITYVSDTKRISTIKDGAERTYKFIYNDNNLLTKIAYRGFGTSDDLRVVKFGYSDSSNLNKITYADNEIVTFAYANNTTDTSKNLISTVTDVDGYTLSYTYTSHQQGKPARVASVSEADGTAAGGKLTVKYARNQTTFTDRKGNSQVMQFNNWGNTVSVQDNLGRAQYAGYTNNDPETDTGKGNQMILRSKMQNTVGNRYKNSNFDLDMIWNASSSNISNTIVSSTAYSGSRSLKITTTADAVAPYVSTSGYSVNSGKSITFSAYVKTGAAPVYLSINDGSSTVRGEVLEANSDWERIQVTYTNTTSEAKSCSFRIVMKGTGTCYVDCVQLENAAAASRFNLVGDGDFRYGSSYWTFYNGRTELSSSAAPELNSYVYQLNGFPDAVSQISQEIPISGNEGDCFVVAGWAKGYSAPLWGNREFGIRVIFNGPNGSNVQTIHFNPSVNNWQYVSGAAVAKQDYTSVTVTLAYEYNVNTAYFDGIQLYKETYGTSYVYKENDNGEVITVTDLLNKETKYTYGEKGNVIRIEAPTGTTKYSYNAASQVTSATMPSGVKYTYEYDAYGNNTAIHVVDSEGNKTKIYAATYDPNYAYNRQQSSEDALGKVTRYGYGYNYNMLNWIQYPEDTVNTENSVDTRTKYTYNNMQQMTAANATLDTGETLSASYTYSDDLLTAIETASTAYNFSYGNFGLRQSVKVGTSRTLAEYSYQSLTNFLTRLDYGNGNRVEYTYNDQGQVTKETYEDGDTVVYRYDNSGALASVTDSATGITQQYTYDLIDRMAVYQETGGDHAVSLKYTYDGYGRLSGMRETIDDLSFNHNIQYDDKNRISSYQKGYSKRLYDYDDFDRVKERVTHQGSSDPNSSGTDVLREEIEYQAVGSSQVKKYTVTAADGSDSEYEYTYDGNGNILSVKNGGNTTTYVYDSANQLLRENNQGLGKTWVYDYDDAGNILSKTEYAYTTGTLGTAIDSVVYEYNNSAWGDLLTVYDDTALTYDKVGNPLTWGKRKSYTWEHGRELMGHTQATPMAITQQPEDYLGADNSTATFSVSVLGENVSYQWQVSRDGGTTWTNATATGNQTSSISLKLSDSTNGRLYRCKVTCDGAVLYSEAAVASKISITAQPQDFFGTVGSTVQFSVTATGTNLTYQWEVSKDGGATWSNATANGNQTSGISFTLYESYPGRMYRCKLSDGTGTVYTDVAVVQLDTALIGEHPEDFVGIEGTRATFAITPRGENLTYQWEVSTDDGATWKNSIANGNQTVSIWMNLYANYSGRQYRCKVTDANGNTQYSNPATLSLAMQEWQYEYNADGLRTKRTNGYSTYEYVYLNGQLVRMLVDGNTLSFHYDADGKPMSFVYNGTTYYYATNLQGDIVAILSKEGTQVVAYSYDAWGNILSITGTKADTIGKYNPLRYRGYVYDNESKLYYLQSRYYDPYVGRFINADTFATTGQGLLGNNQFAYCQNNPVIYYDSEGHFLCTAVGAIGGALSGAIWGLIEGKSGVELEASIMSGAASGAVTGLAGDVLLITGGTAGAAAAVVATFSAGGSLLGNLVETSITGKEKTLADYLTDAAWSAGLGALGGYMGGSISSQINTIKEYGFTYVTDRLITQESASFYSDMGNEIVSNFVSSVISCIPEGYAEIFKQLFAD